MDLPTPTPPPPISGYRSRAINAAVDFAAALRPVAGPGVRVADGPGGKTISVDARGLADVPRPWTVRVVPLVGEAPSQVEWRVRVWAGLVVADGAAVAGPEPGGVDEATGLEWHDAPEGGGDEAPWLCVEVAESASGSNAWRLAWRSEAAGETWRAIARLDDPGPPPRTVQLDLGVVDFGGGGGGFGPDADAVEVVLGGTGYNAATDEWTYGDVDGATGKPTYPTYNPTRLYWHEAGHQLLQFRRLETHNPNGALTHVGPEVRSVVFTAVAEMP